MPAHADEPMLMMDAELRLGERRAGQEACLGGDRCWYRDSQVIEARRDVEPRRLKAQGRAPCISQYAEH